MTLNMAIAGPDRVPRKDCIKLNMEQNMFLTPRDASDAIVLYWKGDPQIRKTHRLGQWIMNTFFPGNVDDRLYYEHCHSCAAQYCMTQMVEEL